MWMSTLIGPKGRIFAFEPDAENFRRLSDQLAINPLPWVRVEEMALAEGEGDLRFSVDQDMENHVVGLDDTEVKTTRVRATTLDRYAEAEQIDSIAFLKVDVEGGELSVLNGSTGLLTDQRLGVIQLEFNAQARKFGVQSSDVEHFLSRHGYALFGYDSDTSTLIEASIPQDEHCNLFAIADLARVSERLACAPRNIL